MLDIVIVPVVLLLLLLAFTIWAIVTRRGTTRIVLAIVGGLAALMLGFITLIAVAIYSFGSGSFSPAAYKGPMGEVQLPYSGSARLIARATGGSRSLGAVSYRGDNGRIRMPVGTYDVLSYTVSKPDGNSWTGTFDSEPQIVVKADTITQFRVGEPMVASVAVHQNGDQMSVVPDVRGCAGEDCGPLNVTGFRVLSKAGQVLMEGKFEFG